MESNPRLALVREDLKTQITDLYAGPGTILIVHPKNGVQFNPEFAEWLAETLQDLLPAGVRGMVLPENVTKFDVVKPDTDHMDENQIALYVCGWNDAIKAIMELNK